MTLANVKNYFPYNTLEAYHIDLGYSITFESIEDLPEIIRNAEITHFSTSENGGIVTVYCKG